MKSKAVLAILVGTTISLSACGQAAQSAEVTVNEVEASGSSSGTLAYSLSDGESLSGGTYDAENEDESAIGAGGSVAASISGAAINKTAGDATSAETYNS